MAIIGDSIILVDGLKKCSGELTDFFWSAGEKPALKITSKAGLQLIASPDTKIHTSQGWVTASELQVDISFDTIPQMVYGSDEMISNFGIPWTRDTGRLVGLLTASGRHFQDPGSGMVVGFDPEDTDLAEYFQKVCAESLKVNTWVAPYTADGGKGSERVRLRTTHAPLVRDFIQFCVRDRINPSIWGAPREAVLGFIEGFLCNNGTVDPSAGQLTLYTISTSERFAREFKLLLLYTTSVSAKIHATPSERTPDRTRYRVRIEKSNLPMLLAQIRLLRCAMKQKLESSKQKSFRQDTFVDQIKSIERMPLMDMYDLVTEDTPVYANGFRIQ